MATTPDDKTNIFQPVNTLPEDLVPTSMQVMRFSGKHLTVGDPVSFDWPGFKAALDAYKGGDFTFDRYDQSTINQESQEAGVMVEKVAAFLKAAFNAVVDMTQLSTIIMNTFTNLEQESTSDWIQFSSDTEKHNSSWEYRVLFSVPFGDNAPSYFYSLVTTIKITADIETETSWWGLRSDTTQNFGVQIDALQCVVKKGFTAPN